jgi:hypothetical protein
MPSGLVENTNEVLVANATQDLLSATLTGSYSAVVSLDNPAVCI